MEVYVSGLGAICAAGTNVAECLESMRSGRSMLAPVRRFQTALGFPVGEVCLSDDELKDVLGIDRQEVASRTALLGLKAVDEALTDFVRRSGNADGLKELRCAFLSGTSVGGMDLSEVFWQEHRDDLTGGDARSLSMHTPGDVTSMMAHYLESRGVNIVFSTTISTACSAAGNAIMLGAKMLREGLCDVAIVGGTDSLCRFTMNGFNSLRILDPEICRPFDESRAGLNLGEGAGYLVLTADSEGALCRLTGWGNANEAYHQTASSPEGIGPGLSMSAALEQAGLKPSDIDFVNTHGTGTQVNDLAESNAMLRVFGGAVPPFSSLKAYTGHTLAASEGIEAVMVCKSLELNDLSFMGSCGFSSPIPETGLVPFSGSSRYASPIPETGLAPFASSRSYASPIPETGLAPFATRDGSKPRLRNILSSAFGFSGNCVSLVFSDIIGPQSSKAL